MKVLMMRPSYRPELSGGTHLAIDLVEDFISSGHEIEVITPISQKYESFVDEDADECKIHRVSSSFVKRDLLSRIFRYIDNSRKMYNTALKIEADILMTHSMPPLLGPLGVMLGKKKKIPVLYWEQDIVSESLISTGVFGSKGLKQKLMYKVAQSLEKKSEKGSTHIITISKLFKKMHVKRGTDKNKISVIYNWIDTDQIYPVKRNNNPLFDELKIPKEKFIVSYCGNLGVPQNVEIMIDVAEMLQGYEDIYFVIIGGGSREEYIKQYYSAKKIKNMSIYPLQPLEKSHYVYSIGDVGLVIGKAGTSRNGFPSKTWSIMAAGQAMIACFDLDSELSEFVRKGNCGIAVEPDSAKALSEAILNLYSNKRMTSLMGKNAREFVKNNFSRKQATGKIIQIAEKLVKRNKKRL